VAGFDWVRKIRVVAFDWGGTLCKTDRERDAILRGVEAVAARLGLSGDAKAAAGASLAQMLQQAYARADADPQHREVDLAAVLKEWCAQMGLTGEGDCDPARLVETFWGQWQGCLEPLDDPAFVLASLRERGYRLALLSNVAAPPEVCRAELERLGLAACFEACLFSSEMGVRKPDPRVFRALLERLAGREVVEPSTVVYVGDSPRWDVGGARRAGMRAVLFRNRATGWPEEDYRTYRPDAIIDRLEELLVLLPRRVPAESS